MNFNNDEKDVLFLSLNAIIKNYEKWNRLENKDKYYFLTTYKKIAENNNSQFNIRYKLFDILKDYDEEYIWNAVFIVKPIVEADRKLNGYKIDSFMINHQAALDSQREAQAIRDRGDDEDDKFFNHEYDLEDDDFIDD